MVLSKFVLYAATSTWRMGANRYSKPICAPSSSEPEDWAKAGGAANNRAASRPITATGLRARVITRPEESNRGTNGQRGMRAPDSDAIGPQATLRGARSLRLR